MQRIPLHILSESDVLDLNLVTVIPSQGLKIPKLTDDMVTAFCGK
jgi:hypothetical protein